MSRAQITGQIFIYIMAALIIGIIVLMAYQAIKFTVANACNAEKIVFMNRMLDYIDRSGSHGSLAEYSLSAPCGYEEICFIDTSKIMSKQEPSACSLDILQKSAFSGDEKNVFVKDSKAIIPVGYSYKISLDNPDNCICIKQSNGRFDLLLEGLGKSTKVSPQSP